MQYVIVGHDDGGEPKIHAGPVSESDAGYLRLASQHLKPLPDEEYLTGPAAILHTMARYSYVLDDDALYWCIEWPPGLVIVRMTPQQEMMWAVIRSPVPNFGGRGPLPEDGDPDDYDGDDNPQYNLVYRPWDAQHDRQYRELRAFRLAGPSVQARFYNALAHLDTLSDAVELRLDEDRDGWIELCKKNLETRAGDGVRIRWAG